MTSQRCHEISNIDSAQCLLHEKHVGACSFNDELATMNSNAIPDVITRAADPNAPRDPNLPQSDLQHRFDLVDAGALFEMTGVLYTGAKKYGEDNWRQISVEAHLNYLIAHAYAYLSGDRTDDHLSNVMCRSMFAKGKAMRPDYLGKTE